ncbi:MAG: GNAT family N-acetyltransferase [Rickettsia sp.]
MNKTHNNREITLKRIRFYNFWLLIQYILIRYKIFVLEDQRPINGEFYIEEIKVEHYILFAQNRIIGIGRIIYEKHIAYLGRIAILKEYRGQGYGTIVTNLLIDITRVQDNITIISLFADNKKISFYKKFGFIETQNKMTFNNTIYVNMIMNKNKYAS